MRATSIPLPGLALLALLCACDTAPVETACGLHGCAEDEPDDESGKADGLTDRLDFGGGLTVVGEPDAVHAVIADLDELAATGVGQATLATLEERAVAPAGKVVLRARPDPSGGPLSCANTTFASGSFDLRRAQAIAHEDEETGRVVIDTPGESLEPGIIRVLYNRECQVIDVDGTSCQAPMVFLQHELTHVNHALGGEITNHMRDNTDPMQGGSDHEEARTIGRGAYLEDPGTENDLRRELGLPLRHTHGSLCGARS